VFWQTLYIFEKPTDHNNQFFFNQDLLKYNYRTSKMQTIIECGFPTLLTTLFPHTTELPQHFFDRALHAGG
jgi:hypothetical protein